MKAMESLRLININHTFELLVCRFTLLHIYLVLYSFMLLLLQAYVTGMSAANAHTPSSNTCCKTSTPTSFLVLKEIKN